MADHQQRSFLPRGKEAEAEGYQEGHNPTSRRDLVLKTVILPT